MTTMISGRDKWSQRHRDEIVRRVGVPDDDAYRCPIPGCGRASQARNGTGLSITHCRYHVQLRNRHGSFWKGTYSAAELLPFRRATERYIKAHSDGFWISHALQALRTLMDHAGPVERPADVLHFLKPQQKARAALARLRRAGIPPERLLAIHLSVAAAVREDPIGPGTGDLPDEYRIVQTAKAAHRLASGPATVLGKYPRSAGLALRHLGRMLERCCEHAAAHHLDAIVALKTSLFGPSGFSTVNRKVFRGNQP